MTKIVTAALAALTLGGALVATSAPAEAFYYKPYGYYGGGSVAAGVAGGLALGAMAAGAAAAASGPYYGAPCYVTRRAFSDDYGNVYFRRVRVCE